MRSSLVILASALSLALALPADLQVLVSISLNGGKPVISHQGLVGPSAKGHHQVSTSGEYGSCKGDQDGADCEIRDLDGNVTKGKCQVIPDYDAVCDPWYTGSPELDLRAAQQSL